MKDVLSSLFASANDDDADTTAKSATTRLKFSLRGRALAGHRGGEKLISQCQIWRSGYCTLLLTTSFLIFSGVTAIDVPSQIYRPDSLVTGGADGLIKLWSLRSPTSGRRQSPDQETNTLQRGRGGDALSVLHGHTGRITFVKTAWHGDRLFSGGADRSLRVWDLSAGGKLSNSLSGHSSWVTQIENWGSNTILTGSADRTVSLWDPRVSHAPLFILRHHDAPITDILVGSRIDPVMVSSAADGTIATWDFRVLSQSSDENKAILSGKKGKVSRQPKLSFLHPGDLAGTRASPGQVLLCRSVLNPETSVMSVGADRIVREWDKTGTGKLENEFSTQHCDLITGFIPCKIGPSHDQTDYRSDGVITSSLDGTVQMKLLVSNTLS